MDFISPEWLLRSGTTKDERLNLRWKPEFNIVDATVPMPTYTRLDPTAPDASTELSERIIAVLNAMSSHVLNYNDLFVRIVSIIIASLLRHPFSGLQRECRSAF